MTLDNPKRILRRRAEIRSEIQRLTSRIQEAAGQLSRLESEAAYLDGVLEFGYRVESSEATLTAPPSSVADSRLPDASPKNPDRKVVASRSLELISAAGRPLSRKTLFRRLRDDGLEVFGKDPLMVLSTMLWRERDRIIRIPGFGYWPVGKPYAPGHYFPDQTTQLGLGLSEPKSNETSGDG
jgi:hypothetical protein